MKIPHHAVFVVFAAIVFVLWVAFWLGKFGQRATVIEPQRSPAAIKGNKQ